jgi:predicted membrane GTPase involved in stress response
MQISQLDYNNYVGVIGIGRIKRGKVKPNQQVTIIDSEGKTRNGKVGKVLTHLGLERIESDVAEAGDIIAITGLGELNISDTICDPQNVEALPALSVDEPTVSMFFCVNTSPFCGKEGKYVTSRQILDRLNKELVHNVALRVEETRMQTHSAFPAVVNCTCPFLSKTCVVKVSKWRFPVRKLSSAKSMAVNKSRSKTSRWTLKSSTRVL